MNIDIINENDLQQYRLRTRRRRIRAQHKDFEKKLLALDRERSNLYHQKRNLGWVALNPPIMRGWKRFFVLRPDIARSKHAKFFEGILRKINTITYSSRKDFKIKKRKSGKKIYIVKSQQLLQPNEWHFQKLKFSEAEQQWFEERYVREKWNKQPTKKFVFRESWRFVLRVRPNMITRVRAIDATIEKRIDEIDTYLDRRCLNGWLCNLQDGYYQWRNYKVKPKERSSIKNMPIEKLLDEHYYENEIEPVWES